MEATVMTLTTEPDTAPAHPEVSSGAKRVLTMSTIAFTLMFAVWLMFGILGVPIQKELGLSDPELAWISAVAVLNGSLWRLPAGMLTDRVGGRVVTISMLLLTAIPCFFLTQVSGYGALLVLAFLVGFAGNLFSVGIAWNAAWWPKERQGFALGVFGAGNVGASVTKLLVVLLPTIIASTAGAMYLGIFPGGWRIFPAFYTVALVVVAILTFLIVPRHDKMNGAGKPLGEMLAPLKHVRVWRFSLYYAAVFGAYVALSAWLPKYYVDNFGVELQVAALLTATFIFPASLLRPVGGWFSDKYGARRVMYWTFGVMLATTGILMMPNGHLVIDQADGTQSEHLAYAIGIVPLRPSRVRPRLRHGGRQGRRLQAHPRVLPRQRRLRRRPRRDVRRARRILPAAAVRLHQGLVRLPELDVLRPVPADRRLLHLDALDGRPHAAPRVARPRPPPRDPGRHRDRPLRRHR
jgi:NNP family nitrate/nitrite transporter-like MFS transporter